MHGRGGHQTGSRRASERVVGTAARCAASEGISASFVRDVMELRGCDAEAVLKVALCATLTKPEHSFADAFDSIAAVTAEWVSVVIVELLHVSLHFPDEPMQAAACIGLLCAGLFRT